MGRLNNMKSLKEFIKEQHNSKFTLSELKSITNGIDVEIEKSFDGDFDLTFNDNDYWDYEEDDLTAKLKEIYNKISEKTTVVRWDDRSKLLVKPDFIEYKQQSSKSEDIHKIRSNGLSINDEELIDLASSTTYKNSIEEYIKIADTDKAKKILRNILNDPDIKWEK